MFFCTSSANRLIHQAHSERFSLPVLRTCALVIASLFAPVGITSASAKLSAIVAAGSMIQQWKLVKSKSAAKKLAR
jgi:hypothetical protein